MPVCLHCGKPRDGRHHDFAGNCLLKYTEAPPAARFITGGVHAHAHNLRVVAEHHTRAGSKSRRRLDAAIAFLEGLAPPLPAPPTVHVLWAATDLSGVDGLALASALLDAVHVATPYGVVRDAFVARAGHELARRMLSALV